MDNPNMQSLKAAFQVTAGVVPGHPEDEFTRVWYYTSNDFENDTKGDREKISTFQKVMLESSRYCESLINPSRLNWVKLEWIWF